MFPWALWSYFRTGSPFCLADWFVIGEYCKRNFPSILTDWRYETNPLLICYVIATIFLVANQLHRQRFSKLPRGNFSLHLSTANQFALGTIFPSIAFWLVTPQHNWYYASGAAILGSLLIASLVMDATENRWVRTAFALGYFFALQRGMPVWW
jgi:hypothetical protein